MGSSRFSISRWHVIMALVAANLLAMGWMGRDASAFSPCSTEGHCFCFEDGTGDEYCQHEPTIQEISCSLNNPCGNS